MATVILGGGIIGLSTAYYLSLERPPSDPANPPIHIIDSSHSLLLSASGYAGGFLASDWFSSESASLGALSFRLHKELADQYNGAERWGYSSTNVYSLSIATRGVSTKPTKHSRKNWLNDGTSRAAVAPTTNGPTEPLNTDGTPQCFTPQPSGTYTPMASPDTTAQLTPRELCLFLLAQCQSRGVQLHLSATPTGITTTPSSTSPPTLTGITYTTPSTPSHPTTLPASILILTAGAWTPFLFHTLFPNATYTPPIYPLAGTSLLARSPRYTTPFPSSLPTKETSYINTSHAEERHTCYALYCAPSPHHASGHRYTYSPEVFARLGPQQRPEIWIGGLNHPGMKLPKKAEDVHGLMDEKDADELQKGLVQLCGKAGTEEEEGLNEDDLEVMRKRLCFRPVSETGGPVVGRVREGLLGVGVRTEDGGGGGGGGVYIAAGHGPWGISLSLGTGKVVSEMVLGREVSADVGGLRVR